MKLNKIEKIDEKICRQMLKVANENLRNKYTKSGNGYYVSVLTKKGNIYAGASYCSDTYTLTMHSEAVALTHAAQHGETNIIAITGPNCHICKQLIYENALRTGNDILIIFEEEGQIKQIPISQLMIYPWPDKPIL